MKLERYRQSNCNLRNWSFGRPRAATAAVLGGANDGVDASREHERLGIERRAEIGRELNASETVGPAGVTIRVGIRLDPVLEGAFVQIESALDAQAQVARNLTLRES